MARYRICFTVDEELKQRLRRIEAALAPRFSLYDRRDAVLRAAVTAGVGQLECEVADIEQQKMLDLRIERIAAYLKPRAKVIVGRDVNKGDVIRAILERGAEMIEQQYGLDEQSVGHVLIDEEEPIKGGKQKRRSSRRRPTRTTP